MMSDVPRGSIRVLLADDHAVVRAGIRQFLQHAGDIQVIAEADDGEIAKKMIEEYHPDVAVLDIQMPRATGIEVTRWVRSNLRGTGISILTAYMERRSSPPVELAMYRIAQEAINNVVRHAGASQARLAIQFQTDSVILSIDDNGRGFDMQTRPSEFVSNAHFGLLGLHERAELIGAELTISSSPGQGTQVNVVLHEN